MKILYLTKYTPMGASSRMRSYQYFPYLEKNGHQVTAVPLFDDEYLQQLYAGKKKVSTIFKAYLKRFLALFKVKNYDLLIIEYEILPYFPAGLERLLNFLKIKYMVDYDDAIFHNYDLSTNFLVKNILAEKIKKVMQNSTAVIAGNNYLADYAQKAKAHRIEIIPTVIDLDRYTIKNKFITDTTQPLVVGWIGTFSTYKYVKAIFPILKEISKRYPLRLCIVGVKGQQEPGLDIDYIPWTEETEAENICKFDIGIMPLDDTPWVKGKCGYKLIQYMASGIPVIATGLGVNTEIVDHKTNGFIANTDKDWEAAISYYCQHREQLEIMGKNGRNKVETKYCLQVTYKQLLKLINNDNH